DVVAKFFPGVSLAVDRPNRHVAYLPRVQLGGLLVRLCHHSPPRHWPRAIWHHRPFTPHRNLCRRRSAHAPESLDGAPVSRSRRRRYERNNWWGEKGDILERKREKKREKGVRL